MATTSNLFSGNGSTTAFTITFPYINTTDVKAKVGGSAVTNFSVSGQTVTFSSAPASGSSNVEIFRDTNNTTIRASFQSGSALRAADFNDNFTQVLYVSQESQNESTDAVTSADAAVATSNTASTNATNAVNTANTASTNASTALSTANTASTNASTALSTANTASTNASTALSTANSASSTATSASSTATTADTNASAAVTTANSASATATAAQNAVSAAAFYTPVANVAGIPGSPSNNDRVEVADSTGIQSFTPLTGYPAGFTGSSGLTARIQYSTSGSTWNWVDYFANDPEDRYYTKTAGTTNATNIATNATNIATKMPLAGGTFTGAVSFDDNVIVKGDATNGSGKLTLNCENNSHGVHIKGPPHSAAATYTLTLPNNTGSNGQFLSTDGSGSLSWGTADVSSRLALAGGTMTGFVTLHADPTANLHASTKQYVDANKVIAIDAGNFDNGSSTISSTLTIDGGSF